MKVLRLLKRSIRDAFKSVFRNFSLSLASISCITITLLIVSISIILSYNIENVANLIKKDFSIVVFLDNDVTSDEIDEVEKQINKLNNIDTYVFESKTEIAESWKSNSEVFKTIIEDWDESENPLADTFSIKVKNVDEIADTANTISNIENVSVVRYGEGIIEQLLSVLSVIEKFLILVVAALILVTVFLVSNTIKVTIFSRRKEIEIMRLVGASNANIKLPFKVEGFFLGLLGSLIPIIITIYGYNALFSYAHLENISPFLQLVNPYPFVFIVSLLLVAIGTIVGIFGSSNSVRKYLKI